MMMEVLTLTTKRNPDVSRANNENKPEIQLPVNYQPSENEEFMNPNQTEYFRQKLLRWRSELSKTALPC